MCFGFSNNVFSCIGRFLDKQLSKFHPIIIHKSKVPHCFSSSKILMYGITMFPFIFIIDFDDDAIDQEDIIYKKKEIINHETIHFQQMLETGVIGFYAIFILEFVIKSIINRNFQKGYVNISFEKEAYKNMKKLDYLEHRKRYNWINYSLKTG